MVLQERIEYFESELIYFRFNRLSVMCWLSMKVDGGSLKGVSLVWSEQVQWKSFAAALRPASNDQKLILSCPLSWTMVDAQGHVKWQWPQMW